MKTYKTFIEGTLKRKNNKNTKVKEHELNPEFHEFTSSDNETLNSMDNSPS